MTTAIANPFDSALSTYSTLQGIDQRKQTLAIQQAEFDNKLQQQQFENGRQLQADQRVQTEKDRALDRDAVQAADYAYKGAQSNGASEVPISNLPDRAQKLLINYGLAKTRLTSAGTEEHVVDPSKLTPEVLKEISPVYRDATPEQVKSISDSFGTLIHRLNAYGQEQGPTQQRRILTEKDDPEMFAAFNTALAPSINKGLDDSVAEKRVKAAVVNDDGTVSFEVESIGKDGKSLGMAPVTYGRANGDPNSMVMRVPITEMYRYFEVNKELGDRLGAQLVALGDDTPIKEQAASLKSQRVSKALDGVSLGDDQQTAASRLKLVKALTAGGEVSVTDAISTAKLAIPDKAPKEIDLGKHVTYEQNGYKITEGYVSDGQGGLTWGIKGRNKIKEPKERNGDLTPKQLRDIKEKAKKSVDLSLSRWRAEKKILDGNPDDPDQQARTMAAAEDYAAQVDSYTEDVGSAYNPGKNIVAETGGQIKGAPARKAEETAVAQLKRGAITLDDLRKAGWKNEPAIQKVAKEAGVEYVMPPQYRKPAPALTPQPAHSTAAKRKMSPSAQAVANKYR